MGRGTLYLMVANGVFLGVGYIIHFGVGRYLGPAEYGIFGVVVALMHTVNIVLTSGFPQGTSKYIAEDSDRTSGIIRASHRIQIVSSIVVFSLYFGLAEVIATFLNDTSLTPYIRVSALAIPVYAFYQIYNDGYLNGLRRFSKQALAFMATSIAKLVAVFTLVFVGFGAKGAIGGYALAALVGLALAWRFSYPRNRSKTNFEWQKLLRFAAPGTLFAVAVYLIMSIDLLAVKALGGGEAEVGYYASATTLAKLPFYLFLGLAMTLLPSISRSTSTNDVELTKSYIRQSMRYMLMLLIPMVLVVSGTSANLITLVYSSRYVEAGSPLSILVFGLGLLSVFYVLANIVMGSGKPTVALGLAVPLVGLDILLNVLMVPRYGLTGAAWATTITGFLGVCAASVYTLWRFKTLVNLKSLGRICLASAVIYIIALQLSLLAAWLPLIYIGLMTLYGGLLWLIRELKSEDLATFKRIMPLERFMGRDDITP